MFVVLTGKVKVFISDTEGHEMILDTQSPGEYVGEMALDGKPRSASVMTLEPSTFSVVAREPIREAIRHNPDFALDMISKIIDRARLATNSVKDLALLDVYGRVARLLLNMAVEKGGKLLIPDKLTQQEIAERVGASRDMVSRIFRDLTAGGYITVENGSSPSTKTARALVGGLTRARWQPNCGGIFPNGPGAARHRAQSRSCQETTRLPWTRSAKPRSHRPRKSRPGVRGASRES